VVRADEAPRTVRSLIERGADLLRQAGFEQPRFESSVLASHCLGQPRAQLLAHPDAPVEGAAAARFVELIARRARGEPTAYLVGTREFFGRAFRVDRRALIPRPETELLVERALRALDGAVGQPLVVDVGTGSGCIAASIALEAPAARVVASDVSADALRLASENLAGCGLQQRVWLVRGNLLTWLRADPDLILANLPYVPREALADVPADVREFEPRLALDGGVGGAQLVLELLDQASGLNFGHLFAELDSRHAAAVAGAARARFPDRQVALLRDLADRDRLLHVGRPARAALPGDAAGLAQ
jgi:release factor glutamine methyltransferase